MTVKPGFIKHHIGERYIVVATGALCKDFNCTIELNETGSLLWDWIAEGHAPQVLAQKLAERYEIPSEDAERDVDAFLKKMQSAGILTD